ncbi:hypothetical protein NNO07_11310 [Pseudomonas resinovorans]|uniref:Uncharacterized protein n=1 Tax=Metapseudomonas resinovorans TaxID=53412 RepID=A0ABT4Y476_METRE|nr:hypothetical protein [Pseudomonas resinovorans]MDA8483660.1 hypothetical protein [Pseudomonas resinovorans]
MIKGKEEASSISGSYFLLCTIFCTLISLVLVLGVIHFTPVSEVLVNHSKSVLAKDFSELDYYEQLLVERLVREKALVTVDSLWSMQVSFYQTIVSLLIGLNAAILAIAFLIIRSSSRTEAVSEAKQQINDYTGSSVFTKLVEKKAKKEISKINSTYDDLLDSFDEIALRMQALEGNVKAIGEKVSLLDKSDDSAADQTKTLTE